MFEVHCYCCSDNKKGTFISGIRALLGISEYEAKSFVFGYKDIKVTKQQYTVLLVMFKLGFGYIDKTGE